jgi:hypothetical protein
MFSENKKEFPFSYPFRPSQASSPLLEVCRTTPEFSSSPVQSIPAHLSEVLCRPLSFFARPLKHPQFLRPRPATHPAGPAPSQPAEPIVAQPAAVSGAATAGQAAAASGALRPPHKRAEPPLRRRPSAPPAAPAARRRLRCARPKPAPPCRTRPPALTRNSGRCRRPPPKVSPPSSSP